MNEGISTPVAMQPPDPTLPPAPKRKRPTPRTTTAVHNPAPQLSRHQPPHDNLLLQTVYFLNAAKTKSVCVGYDSEFEPVVLFNYKKSVSISPTYSVSILEHINSVDEYFSTGTKKTLLSSRLLTYANFFGKRHLTIRNSGGSVNLNADEWICLIKLSKLVTQSLRKLVSESDNLMQFITSLAAPGETVEPFGSLLDFDRLKLEMALLE